MRISIFLSLLFLLITSDVRADMVREHRGWVTVIAGQQFGFVEREVASFGRHGSQRWETLFLIYSHEITVPMRLHWLTTLAAMLILVPVALLAYWRIHRGHDEHPEATKPVEPTGTSSFPSDLTTSHTAGDSPGGSLRR